MSYWYEARKEDIEKSNTDDDEIDIYAGGWYGDDGGNRYVSVKIKYLREILEDLEAKK